MVERSSPPARANSGSPARKSQRSSSRSGSGRRAKNRSASSSRSAGSRSPPKRRHQAHDVRDGDANRADLRDKVRDLDPRRRQNQHRDTHPRRDYHQDRDVGRGGGFNGRGGGHPREWRSERFMGSDSRGDFSYRRGGRGGGYSGGPPGYEMDRPRGGMGYMNPQRRQPWGRDSRPLDDPASPGSVPSPGLGTRGGRGRGGRPWVEKWNDELPPIDRSKTCPFLLRVFYSLNKHHALEDLPTPSEELQIYTWADATLRELVDLTKDVSPEARVRNAKLSFNLIASNDAGENEIREMGTLHSQISQPTDKKTLRSLKFKIGDYIDLAIMQPQRTFRVPHSLTAANEAPGGDDEDQEGLTGKRQVIIGDAPMEDDNDREDVEVVDHDDDVPMDENDDLKLDGPSSTTTEETARPPLTSGEGKENTEKEVEVDSEK